MIRIYIFYTESYSLMFIIFSKPNVKTPTLLQTGINCEINYDDCASNPCDYGICKDGINRYDCVCKPGFTGKSL